MRNWMVVVEDRSTEIAVVLPDIQAALGVTNTFIVLDCRVSVCQTKSVPTHRTGKAAESFIKVEQMGLVPSPA